MCQPAGTWKRNSNIWTPSLRLRLCSCCAEPPALQPYWEKAYPLQGTVGKPRNTQGRDAFLESSKKLKQLFPQEGSAGPATLQEPCAKLCIPGGSWKGTGIPSCTDDPSGRSILVLRESRTFSSMLLRKLVLLFSKITDTVTWLSFWRFP